MSDLLRTWLILLALIAGSLALAGHHNALAAAGLLGLSWLKARAVLGGYLHLARAPGWRMAFLLPLGIWLFAVLLLQVMAVRSPG